MNYNCGKGNKEEFGCYEVCGGVGEFLEKVKEELGKGKAPKKNLDGTALCEEGAQYITEAEKGQCSLSIEHY